MPAARPSSKSKASSDRSSSRPNGTKRFACCAWWCDSTFTRRADMTKHIDSVHFGKRSYCTICNAVMKQSSNLGTHLNTHSNNRCTLCSCGQTFTDPGACTRHREAAGHTQGDTYRKVRPVTAQPVKVQHLAGLALTSEMISDPSFIPPLFDESYHLKGSLKRKVQEMYNSRDYIILEKQVPVAPNTHTTGLLFTDGTPATKYQETMSTEPSTPAHAEIHVDKLNVDYSYEVEIPQRHKIIPANAYTECYGSTSHAQPPSDDYNPPLEAGPSYYPHPATAAHIDTNLGSYPTMDVSYFPVLPQPSAESHIQLGDMEVFGPLQAPDAYSMPMPAPSLDVPHHDFFEGMGFDAQFQQSFYHPDPHFNYMYQPAPAAY